MVVLLATGLVPPAVAGLLAAGAIILSGIMTVEQSYRAIGWTTVILVGAHDAAVDRHGGDRRGQADGRRRSSTWSAMPDPMRCSPAFSC